MRLLPLVAAVVLVVSGGAARATRPTDDREACEACLESGKNWTGSTCSDTCLQDVDCYGPGNPAAPTCPASP